MTTSDRVVLDPDEAVIEAIATVFRRFDELGSARQVMLSLRGDGVLIPRRPTGAKRIGWAPATYPAIHDFLTNPAYTGAFVFGRTRTEKRLDAAGRLVSRTRLLPRDQWQVLIPDHHPGFVSWERFEQIQDQLRANWRPPRGHGWWRGAGGHRAAARPHPLRPLRPDDADRLLGSERELSPLRLRSSGAAVWKRTALPEPRWPPARAAGPRRGLRRARTGGSDRDRARR